MASLRTIATGLFPELFLTRHGETMITTLGHRRYVGGQWDETGEECLAFLIEQGMQPDDVLLDIACGALRLGTKAIPWLDAGNYHGIDKEPGLIEAGIREELHPSHMAGKRPELVVSADFAFERFSQSPDYAVAFSLFTHLTPDLIDRCLERLHPRLHSGSRFFATYLERPRFWRNPNRPNDFAPFRYRQSEMLDFGKRNGFAARPIEWRLSGSQAMIEYRLAVEPSMPV